MIQGLGQDATYSEGEKSALFSIVTALWPFLPSSRLSQQKLI